MLLQATADRVCEATEGPRGGLSGELAVYQFAKPSTKTERRSSQGLALASGLRLHVQASQEAQAQEAATQRHDTWSNNKYNNHKKLSWHERKRVSFQFIIKSCWGQERRPCGFGITQPYGINIIVSNLHIKRFALFGLDRKIDGDVSLVRDMMEIWKH